MENFTAGYSHPSNLLPHDDIDNNKNYNNSSCNNNNNNNEMKEVTKSLLTDAFFQNVLGFRGTVVSWQTFEVSDLLMGQYSRKPILLQSFNLKFKSMKAFRLVYIKGKAKRN